MSGDENDRLRNGTITSDPFDGCAPVGDAPPGVREQMAKGMAKPPPDDRPWPGDEAPAEENPWDARHFPLDPAWQTTQPPARRWLLTDTRTRKGLLPMGIAAQLVAAGGVGKSFVVLQLAIALATGMPWLGTFAPMQEGRGLRVLLIMGEEDRDEVQRRVFRASRAMKAPPIPEGSIEVIALHGVDCSMLRRAPEGNHLIEAGFYFWLRTVLVRGQWDLIIVDPLSRFSGPDVERDNAMATRFVQTIESLAALTGAAVIVTHHSNQNSRGKDAKVDSTSGRGVTGLVDGFRLTMAMAAKEIPVDGAEERAHLGEIVTFAVTKTNVCMQPQPVMLRRDKDNDGALVPLDAVDQQMVAPVLDGSAERTKKTATKEAERDQLNAERERKDAARKAGRQAEEAVRKQMEKRRHDADDDDAARRIIAANPEANAKTILALLKADRACGSTRAQDAVVRVRSESSREVPGEANGAPQSFQQVPGVPGVPGERSQERPGAFPERPPGDQGVRGISDPPRDHTDPPPGLLLPSEQEGKAGQAGGRRKPHWTDQNADPSACLGCGLPLLTECKCP